MDKMLDRIFELIGNRHGAQKELADFLEIKSSVITDWKSRRNKSYKKYAERIAAYYGVSLDWLSGVTDEKEQKNNLTPKGEEDFVLLDSDAQARLYAMFSAAVRAHNITDGLAVMQAGVDLQLLSRMKSGSMSMANRAELLRLSRFLELPADAESLISDLPVLDERRAELYRQLHRQIYHIDPDQIETVSSMLQALTGIDS